MQNQSESHLYPEHKKVLGVSLRDRGALEE